MEVVNTVEIHVFSMPCERCLPHAKIQIRRIYTLNRNSTVFLHNIQYCIKMGNIPFLNTLKKIYNKCINKSMMYFYIIKSVKRYTPDAVLQKTVY